MPSSDLLLAADSGGTKTDWVVFDRSGTAVANCQSTGLARLESGQLDYASIELEIGNLRRHDIASVYLSLGGPNGEEVKTLLARLFPESGVCVEREAEGGMILYAASFLGCGAAVMVGTGSTAVGEIGGNRVYAGGWGPHYGDDGAGGGVGFRALRLYLRSLDGMAECGRIAELFDGLERGLDRMSFPGRMELKSRANAMTRRELALLAPRLYELAAAGDPAAEKLFDSAARESAALAAAVTPAEGAGRVLGCGGFFRQGERFRAKCEEYLGRMRPEQRWVWHPEFSPVKAAMLRLLNREGVEIDSVLFHQIMKGEK